MDLSVTWSIKCIDMWTFKALSNAMADLHVARVWFIPLFQEHMLTCIVKSLKGRKFKIPLFF